jgi:hypothetical protein
LPPRARYRWRSDTEGPACVDELVGVVFANRKGA